MIIVPYLLKSAACMLAFWVFYKMVLEKENMHLFKRYYLLAALAASLIIPTLVFVEQVVPIVETNRVMESIDSGAVMMVAEAPDSPISINVPFLLWTFYGLGLVFFGYRFVKNLHQIISRIRKNQKIKAGFITKVLLPQLLPPHTFFNYVFLNKSGFEADKIPEEVLLHEETHARQFHSIDILVLELVQVLFWFNPMVYAFKKSIRLNHEFLADEAVLKSNIPTQNYQHTLLSYLEKDNYYTYQPVKMAHAINYSSIRLTIFGKTIVFGDAVGQVKKRFAIMRKQTSKKSVILRSILLVPFAALIAYGFSTKREVFTTQTDSNENASHTARSLSIELLGDGTYNVEGVRANKKNLMEVVKQFNGDITPEIRNNILNVHLSSLVAISNKEVWFVYNSFLDYGFYRIVTPNQEIIRTKGNTPFAMNNEQHQEKGATREQMKEYNTLAKKYNEMPREELQIKLKEVERMKYIYGIMTEKQRADAEPFPYFPVPPEPPTFRSPPEVRVVMPPNTKSPNDKSDKQYAADRIDSIVKNQDPNDDLNMNVNAAIPPSPPAPKSPVENIEELAKKGAVFYYEGQKISAAKAIELVKNERSLHVVSTRSNKRDYVVTLSKSKKKGEK